MLALPARVWFVFSNPDPFERCLPPSCCDRNLYRSGRCVRGGLSVWRWLARVPVEATSGRINKVKLLLARRRRREHRLPITSF